MEAHLTKTETALQLSRILAAPVARVYAAWTDPAQMNQWFHPGPQLRSECTVDLRVGGRYEVRMVRPDGITHVVGGVYREIVPEEKLAFTWRWQGEDVAPETLVTVRFRALDDNSTEVTLSHEWFDSAEERDSHAQGWEGTLAQLAQALV